MIWLFRSLQAALVILFAGIFLLCSGHFILGGIGVGVGLVAGVILSLVFVEEID